MSFEHPSLNRGEIIDLISPLSNNSAEHDIAFANRVIDAMAPKFARGGAVCSKSVTSVLDAFDAAVSQELPRVSNLAFYSHEVCKHFASQLQTILNLVACDGQAPCEPSDPEDVAEPIYQVREALVDDPAGTWRDVGKSTFDAHQDTRRRVLYASRHKAESVVARTSDASQAPMTWPKSRDVGRFGDMSPSAHMRVGLDGDNDVYVSVWDESAGASIEFCTPGAGGGSSSRTRKALIDLMVAMEADNADRPDKDWFRAALPQQPDNTACKSVQKRLEAHQPATTEPSKDEAKRLIDTLRTDASGGRAATVHELDAAADLIEASLFATGEPVVEPFVATYSSESIGGKQHDTGRVNKGPRGGFFASTASVEDASLIADALNAYTHPAPSVPDAAIDSAIYNQCPDFDDWHEGPSIDDIRAIVRAAMSNTTEPVKVAPYNPTEEMRWAMKRIDPALSSEQCRALWSAAWSATPSTHPAPSAAVTPEPVEDGIRNAVDELNCAEEVLDAITCEFSDGEFPVTDFNCIGDYITAVVDVFKERLAAQQPATRLPEDVVIGHVTLCKGSNISLLIEYAKRLNADVERLEAQQPVTGEPVWCVATGERVNGEETYTHHDAYVPLADCFPLYTHPAPSVPEQTIDKICYLATEIRFAKSDDAAQAVIDSIRAMLAAKQKGGA